MAIDPDTVAKIQEEGIKYVDYLEKVDKDFLKHLIDNLKRLGGQINVGGAMVVTQAFKFGAKLHMILESDSILVQLYKKAGRDIINTMMQWDQIIKEVQPGVGDIG